MTLAPSAPVTTAPAGPSPVRVMVVDDSAVIRGLITRALETDPGVQVVATVGNGQLAIGQLGRSDVDVIVLDIEMPVMDGLTALPKLLEVAPDVKIIMASTLTQRNAQVSLEAMQKGAGGLHPEADLHQCHSRIRGIQARPYRKGKGAGARTARQARPQPRRRHSGRQAAAHCHDARGDGGGCRRAARFSAFAHGADLAAPGLAYDPAGRRHRQFHGRATGVVHAARRLAGQHAPADLHHAAYARDFHDDPCRTHHAHGQAALRRGRGRAGNRSRAGSIWRPATII